MDRKLRSYLALVLALTFIVLSAHHADAQSASSPFSFHAGQSVYIVAFRRTQQPVSVDSVNVTLNRPDYFDYDLDAERKVRKEIEEWHFFRVVDKPSEADFVLLVSLEDSSVEGLALPFESYKQHFKDKFDLDALREAAYGRYMAGPLNIPTLSRLTDRLVKQFREAVTKGGKTIR